MDQRLNFITLAVADPDGYRWEVAHKPGLIGVQLMRRRAAALTTTRSGTGVPDQSWLAVSSVPDAARART